MRAFFYKQPLFLAWIAMIMGIIIPGEIGLYVGISLMGLAILLLYGVKKSKNMQWEILSLVAILLGFAGLGIFRNHFEQKDEYLLSKLNCETLPLVGIVESTPKTTQYGQRAYLKTLGYWEGTDFRAMDMGMILYCDSSLQISAFDTVYATAFVSRLNDKNPNWKQNMERRGYLLSARTRALQKGGKHKSLAYYFQQIQQTWSEAFSQNIPNSAMAGIASAMFLGDESHIDPEIRKNYSIAGVSHILAISGQHIAMLFMLLHLFFKPTTHWGLPKKGQYALILLALIAYGFLCGGAASVARSVLMFSIVLVAKILRKRYLILNLLGLSGILQQIWNPAVIWEMGFQLSYAAVAGIVILFPIWESYTQSGRKYWDIFLSWIGVSLSAQVATLPFVLFSFGTFPTWFLLSNVLLVIPGYLAVLVGFVALILAPIPGLGKLLGVVLSWILQSMQVVVEAVAALPYPTMNHWQSAGWAYLGLQLLIVGILIWMGKKLKANVEDSDISEDWMEKWGFR